MSRAAIVNQRSIELYAAELRLPTVRRMYQRLSREVSQQGGDYEAYLAAVLGEEVADREQRRSERRVKEARFPQPKLLSDLDFTTEALPPKAQLMDLATCQFIKDGAKVIALGSPGTGKTHVATGLGLEACRQGLRVRFNPVATLASELQAADADHQLHRFINRFSSWDLVILDELGYLPLSQSGAELLFQAISSRHERRSLVITSNLPFPEWTDVFGTQRLTVTLLDRVTHRATILEMNGPSYRLRQAISATATGHRSPDETSGSGAPR